MNRKVLSVCFCAAFASCGMISAYGQQQRLPQMKVTFQSRPVHGTISAGPNAAAQLPVFNYTVTSSRDGNSYSGAMVGDDPFTTSGSVNVPTELVPIILNIGGTVMDPTVPDPHCLGGRVPDTVIQQSPMFSAAKFVFGGTNVGTTQYTDAFQRANFFGVENPGTFHTTLGLNVLSPVLVNVPAADGATFASGQFVGGCPGGVFATVDINFFAPWLKGRFCPRWWPRER